MTAHHPVDIAAELKQYAFFHGFPADLLLVLAGMSIPVTYQPGQFLLEQGKTNDSLFFLRRGRIVIEVDHQSVSELATPGEVLGEMSLISRKPVAASVKALTAVEVYQVSESHLQGLPKKDQQKFQQLLYRVYASVLAERLAKTNEKAKKFEIANKELDEAHKSLRKINLELESEIARRSKELVQKVHDLTISHLQPAQTTLSKWALAETTTIPTPEVQKLLRSISEVVDFLKPVADLRQAEKQGVVRSVLLCDADKKQQTVAKLALGGTGVQLSIASNAEELEPLLQEKEYDLIFCDAEMKDAVEKIQTLKPKTPVALLLNLDMNFYLQSLKDFPDQHFFISRDVNNRTFTIKNISTTVSKILNHDYFGMEKYLSWGARIVNAPVKESSQRLDTIQAMKDYFQAFGVRATVLDRVHTVTEELLMNAIYDAPIDVFGKSVYNHLPRTEKISLPTEYEGKIHYGTDGVLLGVAVEDPFGSLSKDIIMKYLESCYSGQAGVHNKEKGGAGRGLHMMIESADLTIFNVKSKSKTEVISLFNLEKRKDEESHPTFHLFLS
jgi:CRP-like cAMP-binding protein